VREAKGRRVRRPAIALLLLLALASPALGDDAGKKRSVDSKIQALQGKLAAQTRQASGLENLVTDYTARIRALEARVGDVSLRLATLESDLSLHRKRLDALNKLFALQTSRYHTLRREYATARLRLERRLVDIYESNDTSTVDVVLGATDVQEALDRVEYINEIAAEDRHVAKEVAAAKERTRQARKRTAAIRSTVGGETRVIAARASQARSVRDELAGARNTLAGSRSRVKTALDQLTAAQQAEAGEIDALQAASARLAEQIRAEQARSSSGPAATPSAAGLIWPVNGPVTSPFGYRWGRLHEGIDIGVPNGTPIHAAADGTVIYCGWESGYGNLVVIDHGNGIATAYGHQSAIAASCGQHVLQGDIIGYVGSTGHSTGPHLHFEVRVDGNPVDPLGYL